MKRSHWIWILVSACVLVAVAAPWKDVLKKAKSRLTWQVEAGQPDLSDVMIEMADGVRLATDVYLPDAIRPFPVVLIRLPYGKRTYWEVRFWVQHLTKRGFAVVAQDMRGRHASEGVFKPYSNSGSDGVATLDWIIAQPWSNGRVGTLGCSALGESQFMLAAQMHPAHRAMVPIAAGGAAGTVGDRYAYFGAFEGGIFNLAASVGWFGSEGGKRSETSPTVAINPGQVLHHLPSAEIVSLLRPDRTDYPDFLTQFENPEYWEEGEYISGTDRFITPALIIDTWHDPSIVSTLTLAKAVDSVGASTHTIIGAGTHCGYLDTDGEAIVGDLPINPTERIGYVNLISDFLWHHLADGSAIDLPVFKYFTLVENIWRQSDTWPPQEAELTSFFLSGTGALTVAPEVIDETLRRYRSDPLNPVPSIGGPLCCTGNPQDRSGPVFQNEIETRSDLLIYTSEALRAPMRIAGPIHAKIRLETPLPDADLILKILDVDEQGNSLLVQEGATRLRYRESFNNTVLMQPGEIYDVEVQIRDIAYLFAKGHRLRLHIASSSFPRLERNLQTGGANHDETQAQVGDITIHSEPNAPSIISVYLLPD